MLLLLLMLGMALPSQAQEFKRDIEMKTIVPKGQWIVGSAVSFSEHNEQNYQFLIVDGFESDGYTFKVSPMVSYAFFNNTTIGARFAYGRTLFKLDDVSVVIDDETDFSVSGLYELEHSYTGMVIMRNYFNLGNSRRFAVFNEVRVEVGGSSSKVVNRNAGTQTGTYNRSIDFGVGITPGLVAFVNNIMAVEVNIGVLGLNFSKVKQEHDKIQTTERSSSHANFNINIFSIEMGMSFYL